MNSNNVSSTRLNFKQIASAIAVFALFGACSSQQDTSLFTDVSDNTPGGTDGEGSVDGAVAVLGSAGGSGGALQAQSSGGSDVQSGPLGGSAAVVTAFGGAPASGGESSSFGGGTTSVGGGLASGGVSTSSGGTQAGSGGAHLGAGGGNSGGAMAAGRTGGAAACMPAGERCDGRDENCTDGVTDEVCPEDCVGKSYGSHGYMFCVLDGNRAEANTRCNQSSLYLLEINSAEENSWVRRTATDLGIGSLWLGGRDISVEGEWRWVNTKQFWQGPAAPSGTPVAGRYSNWSTGQPNNNGGSQHCARMASDGFWEDTNCAESTSGVVCRAD